MLEEFIRVNKFDQAYLPILQKKLCFWESVPGTEF